MLIRSFAALLLSLMLIGPALAQQPAPEQIPYVPSQTLPIRPVGQIGGPLPLRPLGGVSYTLNQSAYLSRQQFWNNSSYWTWRGWTDEYGNRFIYYQYVTPFDR